MLYNIRFFLKVNPKDKHEDVNCIADIVSHYLPVKDDLIYLSDEDIQVSLNEDGKPMVDVKPGTIYKVLYTVLIFASKSSKIEPVFSKTDTAPDLPDIQRTYVPPDGDTAQAIADDATSEWKRPTTWVVRRRIEALIKEALCTAEEKWNEKIGDLNNVEVVLKATNK